MTLKEVQELIRFVSRANVNEVELETKDVKLVIKTGRGGGQPFTETVYTTGVQTPPVAPLSTAPPAQHIVEPAAAMPAPAPATREENEQTGAGRVTIKAPMIGTFYRSSGPDKGPFVNVGDKIEKGKVICIIEAMKLFNEIESEVTGTIVKVLVNDASPVEYDQPLFLVDPS
ncbi:MAG: acetyl-CoA carboxylase biotin carboxyl carrier protein [Bacteroidia bacterium]|nr:acetyl-CoA carboxylase biotin carboxyl carrier protein [Bacteroidia bacterium]